MQGKKCLGLILILLKSLHLLEHLGKPSTYYGQRRYSTCATHHRAELAIYDSPPLTGERELADLDRWPPLTGHVDRKDGEGGGLWTIVFKSTGSFSTHTMTVSRFPHLKSRSERHIYM
jgi:hypothetical protein